MKKAALIFAALAIIAWFTIATATGGTKRKMGSCVTLLPKGGGTIVNGVFVPLNPGQYLKLCES